MQNSSPPSFPRLGHGLGLRPPHWDFILAGNHDIDWFEIISENFIDTQGRPMRLLEQVRKDYPIVSHGVSLSIGSADPLNEVYLQKLKNLFDRVQPSWFSDHLCWTGVNQKSSHDLLPLPQTQLVIEHIVDRIDQVQNFMGRRMLIENLSSYVSFKESNIPEWEFISTIAKRSGCGILLDINNIYVNSFNHKFDPKEYINAIPPEYVGQFHLAGHTNRETYLIDTHSARTIEPVWDLYGLAVKRFGNIPTLIEWDENIPDFKVLIEENNRAKEIEKNVLA